jgi:hypothetical protein
MGVAAAPTAAETQSCPQVWSSFTVSLLGDRDWTWWSNSPEVKRIPDGRTVVMVHSLGGDRGTNVYTWATAARSAFSKACSPVARRLKAPDLSSLGPPFRVKDRWNYGRGYACIEQGPIMTTVDRSSKGTRVVVRMQRTGKTIAVAEIAGKSGWIRGSKDCDERER